MLEFLNDYFGAIIITITLAITGYIVKFSRIRGNKIENMQAEIRLLKKALIIITKSIDRQTVKAHGEDPELSDLAKDLLTNNKTAI